MRSQEKWSVGHRAGVRRARQIVDRQERPRVLSPGIKTIRYRQEREAARRRAQIARGYLKAANGLAYAEDGVTT